MDLDHDLPISSQSEAAGSDIQRGLLGQPETYQAKRRQNRNPMWYSVVVFVKSTMGLAIFVMPKYFYRCGIVLASLVYALTLWDLHFCNLLIVRIAEHKGRRIPSLNLDSMDALMLHLTRSRLANGLIFSVVKVAP